MHRMKLTLYDLKGLDALEQDAELWNDVVNSILHRLKLTSNDLI
jgi:hypothetical protein